VKVSLGRSWRSMLALPKLLSDGATSAPSQVNTRMTVAKFIKATAS